MSARALARAALTKRAVDAARYTGNGRAPCVVWDGKVPGFGLRVHPTGRKVFVLRYRNQARQQRWMTLGAYGVLTVEQARAEARKQLFTLPYYGSKARARA